MCDKSEGTHSRNSARKYEDDEMEPQLLARQDPDSDDDEADGMEDDGGAQRSTPNSPADSFRSPTHLPSFHQQAQQENPQPDPRIGSQTHTSVHRRMPHLMLRPPNFASSDQPESPRAVVKRYFEGFARMKEHYGCGMPTWPGPCRDDVPLGSTRPRPFLRGAPPAHAADRLPQQQQHQPQPRARNTNAGPEPEAGGAVDGAGMPRKEDGEEVGHARARRHAIHVVQQHVEGGGGQTRQQTIAGQGQRQTAAAHSQQPANQVQHSHNHTSSPAEGGRVGEVKDVVDPRVSSSEGEEDYY